MSTGQYVYPPFHTIGPASLLIHDPLAGSGLGAWRMLGRIADAAVLTTTEQIGKHLTIRGLTQPIALRNRSKRVSLSFRLLENANPDTLALLFGEGAGPAKSSAGTRQLSECVRLSGQALTELSHPFGIQAGQLTGVTNLVAVASGSGGTIPPGTYYYWVVPYIDGQGEERFTGTPVSAGPVVVQAGQSVTLTFNAPPGYQPDGYIALYTTGPSLTNAMQLMTTSTVSPLVISTHSGAVPYIPLGQGGNLIVTDYVGSVRYTEGADYHADVSRGMLQRIAGSTIADGELVVVSYLIADQNSVEIPLGDPLDLEPYRRVKLVQLAPHSETPNDPATWRESGLEFEFFRVQVASGDSRLALTEDDFSEGAALVWECLYDSVQGKVGTVRSSFDVLVEW